MSCAEVASVLQDEAYRRQLDPRSVSTTLTFAVINLHPVAGVQGHPRWHVAVAQIGDCNAYLLRDGAWSPITRTGQSDDTDHILTNVVEPLPDHTEARVSHLEMDSGDVLALMSDGVWTAMEDTPSFADALASLWRSAAPSPAALLYVVDGAIRSYDDDRTFLGIRFGPQ